MLLRNRIGTTIVSVTVCAFVGVGTASAAPAVPETPLGMPMVVSDVLQPKDAGFWNPAVKGTRVLTPLQDGDEVACSAGFEPPISCSALNMKALVTPQRSFEFVDIPVPGAAALRIWVEPPRWGEGVSKDLTYRYLTGNWGS